MKKTKKNRRYLCAVYFLLQAVCLHAIDQVTTIHIEPAGSLSEKLGEKRRTIKELILTGSLNADDVLALRRVDSLSVLNMAGLNIVGGKSSSNEAYVYLTENTIGNSMLLIGTTLEVLVLPETTVAIEPFAFSSLQKLRTLNLPAKVKVVSSSAFYGIDSLTQYTVDPHNACFKALDGVLFSKDTTKLLAFPNRKSAHYTVPDFVQTIGHSAFLRCQNLESVVIPNSVVEIDSLAFANCIRLTSATIPASVTKLCYGAFGGCMSLSDIQMSDAIQSLPEYAFCFSGHLKTVHVSKNLNSIPPSAFCGCDSLTQFVVDAENKRYCAVNGTLYSKDTTTLVLCPAGLYPNVDVPYGVKRIGKEAFMSSFRLTKVTLPFSVQVIDTLAFYNCLTLSSIMLPASITRIGPDAFNTCRSLGTVTIPNGVEKMEDRTFYSCTKLTSVSLPKSVNTVSSSAFQNCSALARFIVNSNNQQFTAVDGVLYNKDKTSLLLYPPSKGESFTLPAGVASIGKLAFANCTKVYSVIFSGNLVSIADSAFINSGIQTLILPKGIQSIGQDGFKNNENLVTMNLPTSLVRIGERCFANCSNLQFAYLPGSLAFISDFAFSGCYSIANLRIPEGVKGIGNNAFEGCSSFKALALPTSLDSIGQNAFRFCSRLNNLKFNCHAVSIKENAFFDCVGLREISCQMRQPPILTDSAFFGVDPRLCKLYVPGGSLEAYSTSHVWKDFTSTFELSAINNPLFDGVSVASGRGVLNIESRQEVAVSVYALSGQVLFDQTLIGAIQLKLESGLYVVRAGGRTVKVMVE